MRRLAPQVWTKGNFTLSTDPSLLDKDRLLVELRSTYWAKELPPELIWESIEGSVPFGLYEKKAGLVGFARVATDTARFAWISDVYVSDRWQGAGLGIWLMDRMLAHPELQTVRRWMLATDDAFAFYEKFGFERIADSKYMVR